MFQATLCGHLLFNRKSRMGSCMLKCIDSELTYVRLRFLMTFAAG